MTSNDTRELLEGMGFPVESIEKALAKYPNEADKAVDHCLNPSSSDQSSSNWGDSNMAPAPSPRGPLPREIDDDLRTALQMSIGQKSDISLSTAGWSAQDGSWQSQGDQRAAGPATSSGAGPVVLHSSAPPADDVQMQQAIQASMQDSISSLLAQNGTSQNGDAETSDQPAFEDGLSLMDQLRGQEKDAPVLLRSSNPLLAYVGFAIHAIYAIPAFRIAIINLPLEQDPPAGHEQFTFDRYWRGNLDWQQQDQSQHQQPEYLRVTMAVQRLFLFMQLTKRRIMNLQDLTDALRCDVTTRALQEPVRFVHNLSSEIFEAAIKTFAHLYQKSIDAGESEAEAQAIHDKRLFSIQMCGSRAKQAALDAHVDDSSMELEASLETTSQLYIQANKNENDIYSCLDALLGRTWATTVLPDEYTFFSEPRSNTVAICINRDLENSIYDFGEDRTPFSFPSTLRLGRFGLEHAKDLWTAKYRLIELDKEMVRLQQQHKSYSTNEGKDQLAAAKKALHYFEVAAKPVDDEHKAKQEFLKVKLQALQELLQQKCQAISDQLKATEQEMQDALAKPDWAQKDECQLVSAMFWTGSGTRDNVLTYLKSGSVWYKASGTDLHEVELQVVTKDLTGSQRRAGVFLLCYDRPDHAVDTMQPPEFLADAINADNHEFAKQFENAPEVIAHWDLPPLRKPKESQIATEEKDAEDATLTQTDSAMDIDLTAVEETPVTAAEETPVTAVEEAPVAAEPLEPEPIAQRTPEPSAPATTDAQERIIIDSQQRTLENLSINGHHADDAQRLQATLDKLNANFFKGAPSDAQIAVGQPFDGTEKTSLTGTLGQISGKPRWLKADQPLTADQVACPICHERMSLLVQLNAPSLRSKAICFRTLYVYICKRPSCHDTDAAACVKVFRMQLRKDNAYRPPELMQSVKRGTPNQEQESHIRKLATDFEFSQVQYLCIRCGLKGELTCASCEKGRYCSKVCQKEDWSRHKPDCVPEHADISSLDPVPPSTSSAKLVFARAKPTREQQSIRKLVPKRLRQASLQQVEEHPEARQEQEIAFAVMQSSPKQVLRYYRVPDRPRRAIWPGGVLPESDAVPPCPYCGAERELEFQLMPRILDFLDRNMPPFGTILCFTCSKECIVERDRPPRIFADGGTLDVFDSLEDWAEEATVIQKWSPPAAVN